MPFQLSCFLRNLVMPQFSQRRGRRQRRFLTGQSSIGLAAEFLEDRRLLATLTVNTIDDTTDTDSALSLREAILLVNESGNPNAALGRGLTAQEMAQIDLTNAFGVNDAILFDPVLAGGTITLQTPSSGNTRLEIFRDVTITGLGASQLTIDGQDLSQIFFIGNLSTSINVTIDGLSLTRGNANGTDTRILSGPVDDSTRGGRFSPTKPT